MYLSDILRMVLHVPNLSCTCSYRLLSVYRILALRHLPNTYYLFLVREVHSFKCIVDINRLDTTHIFGVCYASTAYYTGFSDCSVHVKLNITYKCN